MPSSRPLHRRTGHVVLLSLGALALCALAALLGHRWYTSPEQVLQRHLAEVEALPGVAVAEARGDSPWHPHLHAILDDDVTAEQVARLGSFAEDSLYTSMSATLGTATLDPTFDWPDDGTIDAFLYAAALDVPAATPSTRVISARIVELRYPEGEDAVRAADEVSVFLAGLPDDAPPALTSFQVRPAQPSSRRISLSREVVRQETAVVRAVLATVEPLREDLLSLDVDARDTSVELSLDHEPSVDEMRAYRAKVRDVVAELPDAVDLPEDYRVRVHVGFADQAGHDSFEAYPGTASTS